MRISVEEANRQYKPALIFLTLTVRNVDRDDLKQAISDMMKAWNRLFGYKAVKTSVLGYFRALEITKHHEQNTYHPHFHVPIPVKRSYFTGKRYIKQAEWTSLWKRAIKLDYTPIVHVQRVKGKRELMRNRLKKKCAQKWKSRKLF